MLDIIWNFFAVIGIIITVGILVGIGFMWDNIK
jgi:hypothetical protein